MKPIPLILTALLASACLGPSHKKRVTIDLNPAIRQAEAARASSWDGLRCVLRGPRDSIEVFLRVSDRTETSYRLSFHAFRDPETVAESAKVTFDGLDIVGAFLVEQGTSGELAAFENPAVEHEDIFVPLVKLEMGREFDGKVLAGSYSHVAGRPDAPIVFEEIGEIEGCANARVRAY